MIFRTNLIVFLVFLSLANSFALSQSIDNRNGKYYKYQAGVYGFAKYTSTHDPDLGDHELYFNSHLKINLSKHLWRRPGFIGTHKESCWFLLGKWDLHFGMQVFLRHNFVKWDGHAKFTESRVYPYLKFYTPINLFGIVSAGVDFQWWYREQVISGSGTSSLYFRKGIGFGYDLGIGYSLPLNSRLFLELLVSYHHPTIKHTDNVNYSIVEMVSIVSVSVGFQFNIFEK